MERIVLWLAEIGLSTTTLFFITVYFQSTCADGTSVQGRKKRQASDDGIEDISVGSMIEISAEEVVLGGKLVYI